MTYKQENFKGSFDTLFEFELRFKISLIPNNKIAKTRMNKGESLAILFT